MIPARRQERRFITILFSDLSDSTAISAGLEPEQFADLLEQIRVIADRVIPAHGGEIVRVDGDGMLCVFGYPNSHENDGRRATEAALDMHAAMTALELAFATPDRPLHLHSSIHAGLVLLSAGDLVRGKYEILGDATNIAARICDAAGPGEILVSAQTLGGERHFFLTGETRGVSIRGRNAPLPVLPVRGRAAVQRGFEARTLAGLTPFQGRTGERAIFLEWLDDPQPDHAVFCLTGPAGIGKSRFMHQLAGLAGERGWRIAHGYCESYLSARPLQPFRQTVEDMRGADADAANGGLDDSPALEAAIISSRKLLLVIDDWQWADDASRDLLASIVRQVEPSALRCVLASRDAEAWSGGEAGFTALALPPLDRDATLGAIEVLLRSPDPFAVEQIEQASGGSPLLIEELCHALTAGFGDQEPELRGAWFNSAIQARFDRLGANDRELLKLSAVIGHMVPIWLIELLLGRRVADEQLGRLQSADFLFPSETGGTYRFKHGLTRDALYAAIGLSEGKALHGEVLAALEEAAPDRTQEALRDGLAYHAIAAGDAAKGLPYAIAAGDAALAAGALDRAQAHYIAGMGIVPALAGGKAQRDAVWALMNKFGLACIVDPAPDQLAVLERAEAILAAHGSRRDAMRSAYWLGSIAYGVGLGKRSVRHLESALGLAEACGTVADVRLVKTKLAHSCFASGRTGAAVDLFEALLPGLRSITHRNDREVSAYAHAGYAFVCAERGDYARAADLFCQADAILSDQDNPVNASILLYRSAALVSQGEWGKAIAATDAVLVVSQRTRSRMQNRTCRAQAAYARWKLTGAPDAADVLERVARQFIVPGHSRQHASMVFGWLVDVLVDRGAVEEAHFFMGKVLGRIREGGDRLGEAMGWRAMARAAQESGDAHRASRYIGFARRSADIRLSRSEAAHNLVSQAGLLTACGQAEQAAALRDAAAREFDAMAMPWFRDRALAPTSR